MNRLSHTYSKLKPSVITAGLRDLLILSLVLLIQTEMLAKERAV
jgi:hypothetical protein